MRLFHPVAQAVADHLQHTRMVDIHGVARACVVHVVAAILRLQAIVAGVVDALERQRRPALVALGRVVVDHVEDHFHAGFVVTTDHALELAQSFFRIGCVARIGSEEADAVVAPVVRQVQIVQVRFVDKGVDRQQLDRRHAERLDVVHDHRLAQPGIGASQFFWQRRMQLCITLCVQLVEHGVVPRHAALARPWPLVAPRELRIGHNALGHERRAVACVKGGVVAALHHIAEDLRAPAQRADVLCRVRVQQQLVRVEAVTLARLVGPGNPVAVDGAGSQAFQAAVPNAVGVLRQCDALRLAGAFLIEEAQLDTRGIFTEQGEVGAVPVPGSAQRQRRTFLHRVTGTLRQTYIRSDKTAFFVQTQKIRGRCAGALPLCS